MQMTHSLPCSDEKKSFLWEGWARLNERRGVAPAEDLPAGMTFARAMFVGCRWRGVDVKRPLGPAPPLLARGTQHSPGTHQLSIRVIGSGGGGGETMDGLAGKLERDSLK